jgi:MoxR-like ATPase
MFVSGVSIRETTLTDGSKDITTKETPGRAATANVVVLDETWKVKSPEVLNGLLDLTRSGGVRHEGERLEDHARVIVGISNETPEPGGDFDALWARYILRVRVRHLELSGRKRMVRAQIDHARNGAPKIAPLDPLTLQDLDLLQDARPWVELHDSTMDTTQQIMEVLRDQDREQFGWLVTDDRRFGYIMRCLMAHALISGRSVVTKEDLSILSWMMWNREEQIEEVEKVLVRYIRTPLSDAREYIDTFLMADGALHKSFVSGQPAVKVMERLKELMRTELPNLANQAAGTPEEAQIRDLVAKLAAFSAKLNNHMMGIERMTWDQAINSLS